MSPFFLRDGDRYFRFFRQNRNTIGIRAGVAR
jgi:hypothetical protein